MRACADLGPDLTPACINVELTDEALLADGRVIARLSDVRRAFVEPGVNVSRLVLELNDGRQVEALYFTRPREEDFRRMAEAINRRLRAEGEQAGRGGSRRERRASTIRWLYTFARPYRRRLIIGTSLALVATALNLVPPYLLKVLIDSVLESPTHPRGLFTELIATLLGSYVALTIVSAVQNYVLNSTGSMIINHIRHELYRHVVNNVEASFIDRVTPSRILSRLTTDAGNTNWLMVWGLPTVLTNVLTVIGIGVILFTMDARLAIYLVIPVPLVAYMIYSYRRKSHRLYHRNWRNSADVTSLINDTVPNYVVIRSFGKEEAVSSRLESGLRRLLRSSIDITIMNQTYWPLLGFLLSLATVVIWWVGGTEVISGAVKLGVLVAFVAYASQFYAPINNLGNVLPFVQQSLTSADRLRELLEAPASGQGGSERPNMRGDVEFKDVTFGYDPLVPVVKGVNIRVRGGSRVAVVGRSGSGKSTLVKLLLGLYRPQEGSITVDGVDVSRIDRRYFMSRVAYVPQDVTLFYDTIGNNIAFGAERPVGPREIIEAARAAMIHGEIAQFPLAYDTIAGERGTYLSGGQRQRVGIARALIKDPDLVILDEATSNLDVESETLVYQAITNLTRGRTTIMITHNPVEIMGAEQVVVMEDGRVVEVGTPRELMESHGKLYELMSSYGYSEYVPPPPPRPAREAPIVEDPSAVKVMPSGRGSLVDVSIDGVTHRGLRPKLLFPITHPEVVGLYDGEGNEVAIILDMNRLDEASRRALADAIRRGLVKYRVSRIKDIVATGDGLSWRVIAVDGSRSFEASVLSQSRGDVLLLNNRIAVIDSRSGVIYEVYPDQLDGRSLKLLRETVG
ncbi:ABC transporter, ATP binding protein [Acidilobus saccharovorans 345-15]|uniref:ABC transporter, ATP binding protein n=1 Tax=Acidilobus saccharovorans (strain DSM 16705 / JCM 18335 / VKM B-2471 / 345-15) TaxID=666510 RepID=D9Q1C3_ACIS3|nr:DUF1854 domain-containing protein [Acidilobus saccharovorans]ADL19111.1 ABC transporter, ATP binding protein [Acidilobus saccharovorans 345-15]